MKFAEWMPGFFWASLGRRETWSELLTVWNDQRARLDLLPDRPQVTVVVLAAAGGDPDRLRRTRDSLLAQSYDRVSVLEVDQISKAQQRGLEGLVGVLEVGEVLSPVAIFRMVASLPSTAAGVYCNEIRGQDFFSKARFSEFDLRHFEAVGRFWLLRAEFFQEANVAQDFWETKTFLHLAETGKTLHHLPFFFCYRPGREWVRFESAPPEKRAPRLVSVIICFRNRAEWTARSIREVWARRGEAALEFILVNNQSQPSEVHAVREAVSALGCTYKIVDYEHAFNFARMHNVAVRDHASGDLLFLLNNDVFLQGPQSLDSFFSWAMQSKVGTVGMRLHFENGAVQHAGLKALPGDEGRLVRMAHEQGSDSLALQTREVYGSSFAACAVPSEVFESLGGLDEIDCANGFGDVVFNLEARRRGLRNLFIAEVQGVHLESASRGSRYEFWEEHAVASRYADALAEMLVLDTGLNRVPWARVSFVKGLKRTFTAWLRERAVWLDRVKASLQRLQRLSTSGFSAWWRELRHERSS